MFGIIVITDYYLNQIKKYSEHDFIIIYRYVNNKNKILD